MWVCNSTFVKLLPTLLCENKHVESCPIMIDASALRDTGLFTSHQHHALEKAYWFDAFHAHQTTPPSFEIAWCWVCNRHAHCVARVWCPHAHARQEAPLLCKV